MGFAVGVDLGREADHSTIAVARDGAHDQLYVVHLHRFALGTSYLDVVDGVMEIVSDPRLQTDGRPPVLAVDQTGVGAAVTDLLLDRGLAFYAVTITATGKAKVHDAEGGRVSVRVTKRELIEALAAPLRAGRLKVAPRLRWGSALAEELLTFRRKQNERTGHVRWEHERATDKDDLILATALACWAASAEPGAGRSLPERTWIGSSPRGCSARNERSESCSNR